MYHLPAIIMFLCCKTFIYILYLTLDKRNRVHRYSITTIHSQYKCIHKDVQLFVGLPKCNFLPLVYFLFLDIKGVCVFSHPSGGAVCWLTNVYYKYTVDCLSTHFTANLVIRTNLQKYFHGLTNVLLISSIVRFEMKEIV